MRIVYFNDKIIKRNSISNYILILFLDQINERKSINRYYYISCKNILMKFMINFLSTNSFISSLKFEFDIIII